MAARVDMTARKQPQRLAPLLWAAAELLEFECGFVELEDEYYADDDTDD